MPGVWFAGMELFLTATISIEVSHARGLYQCVNLCVS